MALSNGLRYAVSLLLLLISVASAAQLREDVLQQKLDYSPEKLARFAVDYYNNLNHVQYVICRVSGYVYQESPDGNWRDYFLNIVVKLSRDRTWLYEAVVKVSKNPPVQMKPGPFFVLDMQPEPCP